MSDTITIAIQKSGRLSDESQKLIRDSGIRFDWSGKSSRLSAKAENFPLEILYLRDDDIPGYVRDSVVDLGIVGQNLLREQQLELRELERLGFGKCRLSIAVPAGFEYRALMDLQNRRIATCYPATLGGYLDERGISAKVHEISGSVEIAPALNLAEAICDLVSTGNTLASNGLREVEVVGRSEAVLVCRPGLETEGNAVLERLRFRLQAVLRARSARYLMLNAPVESLDAISALIPGLKSPSIMPLGRTGWSALHAVIENFDNWRLIEELKAAGAQGIITFPIEQMVP
jgi:ATP phosphoribosyltransferase